MSRYNTPLRYPGGKQKLAPFVAEIIEENGLAGGHYVEPYAGGAGVACELLLNGIVSHIHLNDSCSAVHAFWKSVLSHTDELCDRISSASLSVREWRRQRAILADRVNQSTIDLGFALFYLNRVNRSGIISGGLIGGLAQVGEWRMDARFPRLELVRRVESIARYRKVIHLRNWDAEKFISQYIPRLPPATLVYCDPPYFDKADRLYTNHYKEDDHARIAGTIQAIDRPWIVSYDAAPQILENYSRRRGFVYGLQYNAARAYMGSEVFFFSDLLSVPRESVVGAVNQALSLPRAIVKASTLLRRIAA